MGQNQPVEFHFFLLGNPGIVIQPLEWNCKVTFLNKPWALVRKYLRLAPEELSASMITAAQIFWRDATPTDVLLQSDMCLAPPELSASTNFHLLANDMEWWGILISEKTWLPKWNFKMKFHYDSPAPNSMFKRAGITPRHYTARQYTNYTIPRLQLQLRLQLHYLHYITATTPLHSTTTTVTTATTTALHHTTSSSCGEVTAATTATIPKNMTPTTFRSISGFAQPSVSHNNQPLL